MPLHPEEGAIEAFAEASPDEPVVMLNLLRYAGTATGTLAQDGWTGRDAYREYSRRVAPLLEEAGAAVLYHGEVTGGLIVEDGDVAWDEVLVVRYPTRRAFLAMVASAAYRDAVGYRTAALADSRLIATAPAGRRGRG
jgi:uncharacterized protein (DUF1330 family)